MATPLLVRRRRERAREALSLYADRQRGSTILDQRFWTSEFWQGASGGLRQPYSQHTWVYAAASWISTNAASVPFRIYTGDEKDKTEVLSGPWYDFFDRPNPDFSRGEFWELTLLYLMLPPGETFWLLRNPVGDAIGSERESPRWAWPVSGAQFQRRPGIPGWVYRRKDGQQETLEPWQVVHFRLPNPDDPDRGQSPIEAARQGIRTDHKAGSWNEAMLDNGADPGVVLKMPNVTADQIPALRRQWEDRHRGAGNANKVAILSHEKADVIRTSLTHTDMGFLEQRKWNREEVAAAYHLPLFCLSVLGDTHRETSREALKLGWTSGVIPHLTRIEGALENQLFRRTTGGRAAEWGEFDTSQVTVLGREEGEKRELAKADFGLGVPLNEIIQRHDLGYEEQEFGDVGLVPMALVPLRDVVEPLALEPPPAPPPPNAPPQPPEDGAEAPEDEEPGSEDAPPRTALRGLARAHSWRAFVQGVHGPAERRMKSRLVGYFYGRRAEVLAWIEREAGRASSFAGKRAVTMTEFDAWLSGQRERWDAIIARETKPATEQAVSQSFARLEDILGMPLESAGMSHPEVLRFLEEQGARKGRFVNATLSETLRTEMRGLLTQEATIKDISERMRDVFRVSARHATTIARTEVGAATNGATYLGYKLEGIEKHSWLSAMDEKVRHTHQIDGEIRTVGEAFSNGLMYPMDVGGPAEEVINCRCTTVPEV